MANWIKNNLVLVSGIVLPVLLVLGFMLLTQIPRSMATPPEYDFLVQSFRYDRQVGVGYRLSFEVRDGRLDAIAQPIRDGNAYDNRQHARLFRYLAKENEFVEIDYELPEEIDSMEDEIRFPIAEVAGLQLDKRLRAPDGYAFENLGYRGRGGLLGELFGMGRRYEHEFALSRDGEQFLLPSPLPDQNYYGQDVQFLAWITGGAPTDD